MANAKTPGDEHDVNFDQLFAEGQPPAAKGQAGKENLQELEAFLDDFEKNLGENAAQPAQPASPAEPHQAEELVHGLLKEDELNLDVQADGAAKPAEFEPHPLPSEPLNIPAFIQAAPAANGKPVPAAAAGFSRIGFIMALVLGGVALLIAIGAGWMALNATQAVEGMELRVGGGSTGAADPRMGKLQSDVTALRKQVDDLAKAVDGSLNDMQLRVAALEKAAGIVPPVAAAPKPTAAEPPKAPVGKPAAPVAEAPAPKNPAAEPPKVQPPQAPAAATAPVPPVAKAPAPAAPTTTPAAPVPQKGTPAPAVAATPQKGTPPPAMAATPQKGTPAPAVAPTPPKVATAAPATPPSSAPATPAAATATPVPQNGAAATTQAAAPKPAAKPKATMPAAGPKGPWMVHLTSSDEKKRAQAQMAHARAKGLNAQLTSGTVEGRTWYRVTVGGFATPEEARAFVAKQALDAGFSSAWIAKKE